MRDADPFQPRRRRRGATAAGLLAAVLSAVAYQCTGKPDRHGPSQAAGTQAARTNESFDFYLLALSLAPAFCEDGHQRQRECRSLDAQSFAATPLTLHGLWPENLRPESYARNCRATALDLEPSTRAALQRWMPGVADGLATHEWRAHGACTGMEDDAYFNAAMRWTEQADAALGPAIRDAAGESTDVATLRAAANAARPGFGESLVFICKNLRNAPQARQRRPYLTEVRVCLDNDGPAGAPQSLLRCAAVQRRDQGCGGSFEIDAP